jgi:hypothetical protein
MLDVTRLLLVTHSINTANKRSGVEWTRVGILKLRGSRKGKEESSCHLYIGKEDAKVLMLSCPETRDWRIECLCKTCHIKIDLREIGWDGVDWIDMAQDTDQWRALVNTVLNLRVP